MLLKFVMQQNKALISFFMFTLINNVEQCRNYGRSRFGRLLVEGRGICNTVAKLHVQVHVLCNAKT